MKFNKVLLISASLGIGVVGLGYLISPQFMYGLYNIDITSTNQFNMVRGAYSGLFLSFSLLFFVGAINEKIEFPAMVSLFVFMSGFAIGRITSVVLEGMPGFRIIGLLLFELFYSICSAYYLFSKK